MIQQNIIFPSLIRKPICLLLIMMFVGQTAFSQDTLQLRRQINQLHSALVNKDVNELHLLLHPSLSYGHSNGWVQNINDMSADLLSGKIVYKKLEATLGQISLQKNIAQVRCENDVEGVVNGNNFSMKLHVLQVWVWEDNKWTIIARQSTKL